MKRTLQLAFAVVLFCFLGTASLAAQQQNLCPGQQTGAGQNQNNFGTFQGSAAQCSQSVSSSFIINTVAGNFASCGGVSGGFSGDTGIPQSACLFWPSQIVFDSAGNYYFADLWNNRIRAVNMQGTSQTLLGTTVGAGDINTVAGASSTNGFAGDDGPATAAAVRMGHPVSVVMDGAGNLYIADQQSCAIRQVNTSGTITTLVGGTNPSAAGNFFPGDNVPIFFNLTAAGTASAGNTSYTGTFSPVPAANTWIYVHGFTNAANNGQFQVQTGTNGTTLVLNNASGVAETKAAKAHFAELNYPQGIAVNSAGTLIYIADTNNERIRVANLDSVAHTVFGVTIAAGQINTVAGTGVAGYADGPVASAKFDVPLGIIFDGSGDLFVADDFNNVVREISAAGTVSTAAGSKTTVSISAVSNAASVSTYTYTVTSGPALVAGAANNNITITGCTSSANNGTFKITGLGAGTFTAANASGVTESETGAAGTSGISGYSGDTGAATSAKLDEPFDVKFDLSSNLLIADQGNFAIRRVIGGIINTIAGTGTGGYSGDGNTATLAEMGDPTALPEGVIGPVGVTPDSHGNIYVGDIGNNLVRVLYPAPVAAPTVTSITPNNGTQSGGTPVTIGGTGFMLNAVPSIGGTNATGITVVSPTSITATTPPGSVGAANVTVTNATGQSGTDAGAYTYNAAVPTFLVEGVSGATAGTSPVTIATKGANPATLIVAVLSSGGSAAGTVSDNCSGIPNANLWNYTETSAVSNTNVTRIAYAFSATGGGPLVTCAADTLTGVGTTPSLAVYAFYNTLTSASVLDVGSVASGVANTALQAGSVTPAANDACVIGFGSNNSTISAVSIDTSFLGVQNIANGNAFELVAGAYGVNVTGSAINPKFTATTGANNNIAIACFK